jgi:hypothetical protein
VYEECCLLLYGPPSDANKVDAVAVALAVGKIVPEMRSIDRHGLTIAEAAHVFPDSLFIAKARPAVVLAFTNKGLPGTAARSMKERFARIRVVKGNLLGL